MKHILLVEPDYMLADVYVKTLSDNYEITVARDAQSAVDTADNRKIDLIITDTLISDHNGIEVIYEIRSYADWMNIPIIMLSSLPMTDFPLSAEAWLEYGVKGFAYKPKTKPYQLLEMADAALV